MASRTTIVAIIRVIDLVVRHIEEKAVALGILGLSVVLITNVVLRMFNSSLPATEELSQFLIFYITFLGTSFAARSGTHIRMSMLSDAVGRVPRKVLAIVIAAGTSAMMFYLSWLSFRYVMTIASLHRVSPILQIPVQYVWVVMPAGLFLTGIQYALALFRNIASPGAWISYSEPMEGDRDALGVAGPNAAEVAGLVPPGESGKNASGKAGQAAPPKPGDEGRS
jgi:TRAP-type C4-dicarboxylate transport system permease small subunit